MQNEEIVFGTYTKRSSKGVYQAILNEANGQLEDAKVVAQVGGPTYTTQGPNQILYVVDKRADQGGVAVVDRQTGEVKQEVLSAGASPAYLGYDAERQLLYVGNYHKGTAEVYQVAADGQLTLADTFTNHGSGPRPEQESSHVHFTNLTPDQKLVVVDLGTDEVFFFDVQANGKLRQPTTFKFKAGFGPRHIRFSPDGKTAYVLGELSSQLAVLDYTNGQMQLRQTLSTIPADWTEHNGAAALRVTQDGRFVYASNRGNNTVAVFAVQDDSVKRIQLISTEGDFPRDMALNQNDAYLVVANQNTDNVSVYARNPETGMLKLVQQDFLIPEGVRVEFIK